MDTQVEGLKHIADAIAGVDLKSASKILKSIASMKDKPEKGLLPADAADQYLALRNLRRDKLPLLRYYKGEWYRYNGMIYVRKDEGEIKADIMRYLRHVDKTRAKPNFQSGVIANLHSLCEMPSLVDWPSQLTGNAWETRREWIVVQNGIVDLNTPMSTGNERRLMAHTPTFFSTVLLPYAYDPHAGCPRWESFIAQVWPDRDCQLLMQEIFGYCLTFNTTQQKFFLLLGEGSNGKGVLLRVLRLLVGPENISAVSLARLGDRFELGQTLGKLACLASEVDNVRQLDEAVLKQFTGEDPMRMEHKYKHPFTAMPTAKLIIAANVHLPFKDRSEGIWRRLMAIPFTVTIPEAQQNKNLSDELAQELSGILNWAVMGQDRLRVQGRFTHPAVSQDIGL